MDLIEHGLYIIKDEYFATFPSAGWTWNKKETRPHFLAIQDASGMMWMIPLSSQAENYHAKIKKVEERRGEGNCVYYHIGIISSRETAFIISGMFPITEEYISRPYRVGRLHYIVKDTKLTRQLRSKVQRYLRLLEQGVMRDTNHVLQIRDQLSK